MKIKINDDWGIKSDEHQYNLCRIVDKKVEKDGAVEYKEHFKPIRYAYRTLPDVLDGYIMLRTRTEEDITDFRDLKELHYQLQEEVAYIKAELDI